MIEPICQTHANPFKINVDSTATPEKQEISNIQCPLCDKNMYPMSSLCSHRNCTEKTQIQPNGPFYKKY